MKNSLKMKFYFIIIIFGLFIYFSDYANCFGYSSIKIDKEKVKSKLFSISIPFIENKGFFNNKIAFYTKTFGGTVYITKNGNIIYVLPSKKGKVILKEIFINNEIKKVRGEIKSTTKVNYIYGKNLKQWITNLSTYDLISLNSVWKGIKVKIKAYGNKIEKLFYIYPGSEAEKIKIKVEGAKKLYITKKGELNVKTPKGNVYFTKPIAYQEINGKKKFVKVSYVVKGNIYSFKLGKYDKTKPVIIDPLLASTYLGSNGWDFIITMTTDSAGNVYVAGYTNSSDFPVTSSSFDPTYNGIYDGFISKLSSNLSSLLASTYIGGSGEDYIYTMAIDSAGNVYVAGHTASSNFPVTSDTSYNGLYDGFVSKLNSILSFLFNSTYVGGSSGDFVTTMTIDSAGNIYVAGYTYSFDFPITSDSFDTTYNDADNLHLSDSFIVKVYNSTISVISSENSSENENVSTNNNSTNTNKNTTITIGCYMNPHAPFTLDLCMLLGLPIIYFFIRRKKNLS